jgi:hypothetical protein
MLEIVKIIQNYYINQDQKYYFIVKNHFNFFPILLY